MHHSYRFLLIVGTIIAITALLFLQKVEAGDQEKKSKSFSYDEARSPWFSKSFNEKTVDHVYIGNSRVEAVGMEFTIPQPSSGIMRAVVLAGAAGDASIYFQSNNAEGVGGYIGGITHKPIAKAATEMVANASRHIQLMEPTQDFPYVSPGNVRFIVLTKDGMYTKEVKEQEVTLESHPFFDLYAAGQQVITAYRELDQKQKR